MQTQFPFFLQGVTNITTDLAFKKENGQMVYFNFGMPVFMHDENDSASFRMITSQFCVNGTTTQSEISKTFGVSLISVKRAVKLYRRRGPKGFYEPRNTRGPVVLTKPVLGEVQQLLDDGLSVSEVAKKLTLKSDTLQKAIHAGRLHKPLKKTSLMPSTNFPAVSTTKSERSEEDSAAPLGVGATNVLGRLAASLGALTEVSPVFQTALDISFGGVLLALPALLACGLLKEVAKHFRLPKGYYGLQSLFLLLAFMALARIKTIENFRYCAPGEWGKLLGLDRVPEVRTLREKLKLLTKEGQPEEWSAMLCADWMQSNSKAASILYIDGHVRVYHGEQTQLPRHYVSREKLCLRATVDYWVNAMDGQPFLYINKAVDPGLLQVLEGEIVPRLEKEVPAQPLAAQLEADPLLHRFTLIFDREGYSPDFMKRMKEKRIACITYHKHPGEDWAENEFSTHVLQTVAGNLQEVQLAERGTFLPNRVWVREVRRLTENGHQTAILSTDYRTDLRGIAAEISDRWCQENFFRYMLQHYNLDRLIDYSIEPIPATVQVINPSYRRLEGEVRRLVGLYSRRLAEFGGIQLEGEIEPAVVTRYEQKKAVLQEEILALQQTLETAKQKRRETKRHIPIAELPPQDKFDQLSARAKHFLDTIKMVSYRAETAMVNILREKMARSDDGRSLLRSIYESEVDLLPDETNKTLTVRLHHLATRSADAVLRHLCAELNESEVCFPGTDLRIIYKLGSSENPWDQEV